MIGIKMFLKVFNIKRWKRKINTFLVNRVFVGTNPKFFEFKRKLLNSIGYEIGKGTKIVGPIYIGGKLKIGENCWIGKNFSINGNGSVTIGDNCDIAPEVTLQTGSHVIGGSERRAGNGYNGDIIGNGVWLGVRTTILNDVVVGDSCVVGACACVNKSVENNKLVGGVPARVIKDL